MTDSVNWLALKDMDLFNILLPPHPLGMGFTVALSGICLKVELVPESNI
jgi:hypothetical protein